jgi:PAS domain S-box-containing protein
MTFISLSVVGVATYLIYKAAIDEERARLTETAQSQARLIEAVARFDTVYSKDYPEGAEKATLTQIIDAHANYKGFGETGEFTMARREGNEIIFLLRHRHYDLDYPKPVPFDSELAEPMRRALSDLSGTTIGLDYRGEKVMAAHEPVGELNLGIVAKIDMAEIQAPFIRAGLIALGSAIIAILLGALLFFRVTNPMLKKLAESEEKLSSFIDSATEGFVLYDSGLNLIEINKKALEIFPAETTKEDVIGKNMLAISPDLEKTGRYDKYCEIIKTGKPLYFDDVVPSPRFGNRHLSVRAFRVAEGLGLIFTDITERKRIEEKLKQGEEFLKLTQEISHVGSWSLDLENNELIWSDEAYKIFGIKPQEFKASYEAFLEVVHPDDRAMVDQTYTNAVKNKKPYEVMHRVLRPNGEVLTVHEKSKEIVDKTGKAVFSFGMVQDITERKKAEEALENAAEEKETLLKEAHHRIKNNFALVSSLLRMQLAKIKDPDDLEIFKESQNRVLIMARLHEVLHKAEVTGKVNMKAYLTKIISSLCGSYKVDTNRIKVKSNIDKLELNSRTATSCGLIVNELFTNAYKYSFPDGMKGEINITLRSLEGDEIELIVSDNGVGLPKNVDFRDTETLGLHIVKMLAEDQHHGEIKLDRTKGTSFHIRMRMK